MSDIADLSIVIVSWNVKDLLRDCLNSVHIQTKHISFEVFVVDNASSDSSAEMVEHEFPQAKVIKNQENLGFARANNQAIKLSKGRYILLLNPDTILLNNALADMVFFMDEHKEVGAVGPKMLNRDREVYLCYGRRFPNPLTIFLGYIRLPLSHIFPRSEPFTSHFLSYHDHTYTREVTFLSGACMMVSREIINQVGLLNEEFFMGLEDFDWCYRIKKAGYEVYLDATAEVMHLIGESVKQSTDKMLLTFYKSLRLFFRKYYGRLPALGYDLTVALFIALFYPVQWIQLHLRLGDSAQLQEKLSGYRQILSEVISAPRQASNKPGGKG